MLVYILIGLFVLTFGLNGVRYHRERMSERPVWLWGREWKSASAAAHGLEESTGLTVKRRVEQGSWLVSLLLAPVWLLWGDSFGSGSFVSKVQLRRWWLEGASASGRHASIELAPQGASLSISCDSDQVLWALSRRAGAPWPLEQQEGLHMLHPVAGEHWRAAAPLVERLFSLGLDRVRLQDGRLSAQASLAADGPPPDVYPRLLEGLAALASRLERHAA